MPHFLFLLCWIGSDPTAPVASPESLCETGTRLFAIPGVASPFRTGPEASFLYQPAYCLEDVWIGSARPYRPQPGDIFLATDQSRLMRIGHWLVGGAGVHHSGILFARSDGRMTLLEAGPFNSVRIETMDPYEHMLDHVRAGNCVWIRQRCRPLTAEESACLTAFAEAQDGKPFATLRLLGQLTILRSRGPIRTVFVGKPHGNRDSFFCSELVLESCVAAGLLNPATTRPPATYPRDLFFGHSYNLYVDRHLPLEEQWFPPARWAPCPTPIPSIPVAH
jgi:hypothetical protein